AYSTRESATFGAGSAARLTRARQRPASPAPRSPGRAWSPALLSKPGERAAGSACWAPPEWRAQREDVALGRACPPGGDEALQQRWPGGSQASDPVSPPVHLEGLTPFYPFEVDAWVLQKPT